MSPRCYLFDLDGTLADCSHRLHHIVPEFDNQGMLPPKNWRAFFAECGDDKLIGHISDLLHTLCHHEQIIIVSGRSDECREQTEAWLAKHEIVYHALYMRKAGDHRHDEIVKSELVDLALADGWRPIMAFEDRSRVVAMLRKRGIPCLQVADGDF